MSWRSVLLSAVAIQAFSIAMHIHPATSFAKQLLLALAILVATEATVRLAVNRIRDTKGGHS